MDTAAIAQVSNNCCAHSTDRQCCYNVCCGFNNLEN